MLGTGKKLFWWDFDTLVKNNKQNLEKLLFENTKQIPTQVVDQKPFI